MLFYVVLGVATKWQDRGGSITAPGTSKNRNYIVIQYFTVFFILLLPNHCPTISKFLFFLRFIFLKFPFNQKQQTRYFFESGFYFIHYKILLFIYFHSRANIITFNCFIYFCTHFCFTIVNKITNLMVLVYNARKFVCWDYSLM